jgi:hypothetical protein
MPLKMRQTGLGATMRVNNTTGWRTGKLYCLSGTKTCLSACVLQYTMTPKTTNTRLPLMRRMRQHVQRAVDRSRTRPPVVRPISSKDTLLVRSNGKEIPGLRNMEQVVQVRTGLWNFTDCLHDIVCYKIRGPWIR